MFQSVSGTHGSGGDGGSPVEPVLVAASVVALMGGEAVPAVAMSAVPPAVMDAAVVAPALIEPVEGSEAVG